jgi:hypothetical protein
LEAPICQDALCLYLVPIWSESTPKFLGQFLSLGDFLPGSITASVRPCGKPTCHCAKPKDPGYEPQCLQYLCRSAKMRVTSRFISRVIS